MNAQEWIVAGQKNFKSYIIKFLVSSKRKMNNLKISEYCKHNIFRTMGAAL